MTGPGEAASPQYHIYAIGKYQDANFQAYRNCAEFLANQRPNEIQATVEAYYETQFEQRLKHIVAKYGGSFNQAKPSQPLVFAETDDDKVLYFATYMRFMNWASKRFKYEDHTSPIFYSNIGAKALKKATEQTGRSYIALTFQIGDEAATEVQFELFDEECPCISKNFLDIARKPEFQGHKVHRVKGNAWLQAGDFVDGSGLHSKAAEEDYLRHESFRFAHDRGGLLGMCNHGKDTNGSQFYITTRPLSFLDGKFVIFGRVIKGMRTVLKVAKVETKNERPVVDVQVACNVDSISVGSVQGLRDRQEEQAATKLQSVARGRKARKTYQVAPGPAKEASVIYKTKDDLAA